MNHRLLLFRVLGASLWLGLIFTLLETGCAKKATSTPGPSRGIDNPAGQVQRGKERQEGQNDLNQLGIFYSNYFTENGRSPSLDELKAYIQKDAPKIYQRLQEGRYVVVANA